VTHQSSTAIRFGTDGWRAVIAEEYTFANLERVAQAYCDFLRAEAASRASVESLNASPPLVVIGCDRRFLSEAFAKRAAEVVAGNGLRTALFPEPVPTPIVSWAVRENSAAGGIVITASHNPPEFNGFKIKAAWGGSASPEITSKVETFVGVSKPSRGAITGGENQDVLQSSISTYRRQIESYIDLDLLKRTDATVILDSMHGSGGHWVESFLQGDRLNSETVRGERDPLFGGVSPEPIDRNLAPLKARVSSAKALVGLATDGDADRLGAVNELGHTMTMHEVVPLLLLHLARTRGMSGGVVRTFSQSVLTKRIAAAHNLPLYDTPIGFKYIADLMLKTDILIGAEESGGIGVRGHIPERDGILNCLLLLEAVVMAGGTPSEMVRRMHREFGEFYFDRRDLHCDVQQGKDLVTSLADAPPETIAGFAVSSVETLDGTKLVLDDESWLLFRQSGTEPVLRVYSEATSRAKVEALLNAGSSLAGTDAS
jgi:phosphomannomutase